MGEGGRPVTRRVVLDVLTFILKTMFWVVVAHTAVDAAALLNDRSLDEAEVSDARTIAGSSIAFFYGFLYRRQPDA